MDASRISSSYICGGRIWICAVCAFIGFKTTRRRLSAEERPNWRTLIVIVEWYWKGIWMEDELVGRFRLNKHKTLFFAESTIVKIAKANLYNNRRNLSLSRLLSSATSSSSHSWMSPELGEANRTELRSLNWHSRFYKRSICTYMPQFAIISSTQRYWMISLKLDDNNN